MTKQKRRECRRVSAFLTPEVSKKGGKKFTNFQFSFKDLNTVERDDKIRASKGISVAKLAKDVGLSRKRVYEILKRK